MPLQFVSNAFLKGLGSVPILGSALVFLLPVPSSSEGSHFWRLGVFTRFSLQLIVVVIGFQLVFSANT